MSANEEKYKDTGSAISRRQVLQGAAAAVVTAVLPKEFLAGGEYKKYGTVTTAQLRAADTTFTPDQVKALCMPVVTDKRNGTKILVPGANTGVGFGAFVTAADNSDAGIYWTSMNTDGFFARPNGSRTAIVPVFHSDQQIMDRTGDFFLGLSDGIHGGVMVFRSRNGGVDYANTGRTFNYLLSGDLNNPYADHQVDMRAQFGQIVNELAGH